MVLHHERAIGRASLFFYEIASVQALSRADKPICALYIDESDRRVVDFNPAFITEFIRMSAAMFPVQPSRVVMVAGGLLTRYIFKCVKAMSPRLQLDAIEMHARDEVFELVEDPSDVPAQWLRDGRGKAHSPTDRSNQWCFERCLKDEGKITTREVFSPGPWPYSSEEAGGDVVEDVFSAVAASFAHGSGKTNSPEAEKQGELLAQSPDLAHPLETIDEGSGEDEW